MKKLISIILVMCLSLGVFTVAASAEQTKLEKYIDDLSNAETIHVSVPDEYVNELMGFGDIPIKDVELALKLLENADDSEIAIRGKVSIFTFHLIMSPKNTTLYIPTLLCRVDFNKLYDDSAYSAFGSLLSSSDASSNDVFDIPALNLESTSTENVEGSPCADKTVIP